MKNTLLLYFGGGADLFNFARQTGYPRTLPRGWEPNRGLFPRTFLYPGGEASTNPNVIQRTDTQTRDILGSRCN